MSSADPSNLDEIFAYFYGFCQSGTIGRNCLRLERDVVLVLAGDGGMFFRGVAAQIEGECAVHLKQDADRFQADDDAHHKTGDCGSAGGGSLPFLDFFHTLLPFFKRGGRPHLLPAFSSLYRQAFDLPASFPHNLFPIISPLLPPRNPIFPLLFILFYNLFHKLF